MISGKWTTPSYKNLWILSMTSCRKIVKMSSKISKIFFRSSCSESSKTSAKWVWAKKNFFQKIVSVDDFHTWKKFQKSKNFFFVHRLQNGLKRRENKFERKKNFSKKSSMCRRPKYLEKFSKIKNKIFCSSQRASFPEHWKWLEVLPRYTPACSQHF